MEIYSVTTTVFSVNDVDVNVDLVFPKSQSLFSSFTFVRHLLLNIQTLTGFSLQEI